MPVERLKYLKGSGFQAALRHRYKKWCVGSKRSPPSMFDVLSIWSEQKPHSPPTCTLSVPLFHLSGVPQGTNNKPEMFLLTIFVFWGNISHIPALSHFHGEVSCSWIFIYVKVNGPPLKGLDSFGFFKRDFSKSWMSRPSALSILSSQTVAWGEGVRSSLTELIEAN